ncbi:MAG: hypothetical protein ACI8P3_003970 [Saprospiraceae bacterium]|jgi:hypothetical protein
MKALSIYLFLLFTVLISCAKPPNYPNEPVIEFNNLNRNVMKQGEPPVDTIILTINYTDGDGDLGSLNDSLDVYMTDTRFDLFNITYILPFVPQQGAGNGISGEISLVLPGSCCTYPNNAAQPCDNTVSDLYPTDTIVYEIYIKDRAGNESNRILTENIILLCE